RRQRLGGFEVAQSPLGLAAIEMKHRGKGKGKALRERVGEALGQRQRTRDAGKRFSWISEQPFGLSAEILGAATGIMSAVNKTVGRMLLWIVEKAPGVGVLTRFCRIPGMRPGRPSAMMRLEPQSVIPLLFGHPEQPLGERPRGGYSAGHRC